MPEKISDFEKEHNPEISPEFVKRVEGSKLKADDKVNFLLTKAGLKPASELELVMKTEDPDGGTTEHMTDKNVQEILSAIEESGLPYQAGQREVVKRSYWSKEEPDVEKFYDEEKMDVLIGRSQEELDTLIKALESEDDELIGKAFGHPLTAVEAFVGKRKPLNIYNLPKPLYEATYFLSPTLSENNWQEEIQLAKRNADFIKRVSPDIYQERVTTVYGRGA